MDKQDGTHSHALDFLRQLRQYKMQQMCFNIMKLLFHITNILKVIQALFTIFYFKYINKKSQNQKIYLNENRVVGINKSVILNISVSLHFWKQILAHQWFCDYQTCLIFKGALKTEFDISWGIAFWKCSKLHSLIKSQEFCLVSVSYYGFS